MSQARQIFLQISFDTQSLLIEKKLELVDVFDSVPNMKDFFWQRSVIRTISIIMLSIALPAAVTNTGSALPNQDFSQDLLAKDAVVGQQLVMELLDPLLALVNPTEGGDRVTSDGAKYGFAGVIVHPLEHSIDVYWTGDVEPKAKAILDLAPKELEVNLFRADYRLFDMLGAVERVIGKSGDGFTIISAGPEPSGIGFWVEYQGAADLIEVSNYVSKLTDISISSVIVGQPVQTTARWNDTSPYQGGSGFYLGSGICSTSFPVTSDNTGTKYLLSAYHCFDDYGNVAVENDTTFWGVANDSSTWRHPDIDAALIKPTIQAISPDVFYGTWNTTNTETIGAVGGNSVGAFACADGANSGIHCAVVERSNYSTYLADTGTTVRGLVRARAASGAVVVVSGDSGGPVVYPISGAKFRAMGTILGGSGQGICPNSRFPASSCFTNVVWVGAMTVSSEMGMTIITG
jgi:hypothetical protein